MRALNKIRLLVQGQAEGFAHLCPILFFCHRPNPVLDGLNLNLCHKARPKSGHRPTLDLGQT